MSRKRIIRFAVAVAVLLTFGWLFVRSLRDERAAPYSVTRRHVSVWTLALDPSAAGNAPVLSLQPPGELAAHLFRQIFARAMESLQSPASPAIPVVLRNEYDQRLRDHLALDALLEAGRAAGLEQSAPLPRCLVHRRHSVPGSTRQAFVAAFDVPAIEAFRRTLDLDTDVLSPVLIVAGSGADTAEWLPLRVDPPRDCVAPIEIAD